MDRNDARFAAAAIEARIHADLEALDRLKAECADRLTALAARFNDLAAGWEPARAGAVELASIASLGRLSTASEVPINLEIFVDKLYALADEPPMPRNRAERRAQGARRFRAALAGAR